MARRVRRKYRGGRVLDLACGHGLLAHILLVLDDSSPSALAVDKNIPGNAEILSASLMDKWPRLRERIHYKQSDIKDIIVQSTDLVVSAHACGVLTDLVMEKAIEKKARIAVLPCCHQPRYHQHPVLKAGWIKPLPLMRQEP